jgi:hypothetical protein
MKKFTILAVAVLMVFGVAGAASAISYTDTATLGVTLGDGWGNPSESHTWQHNMPSDFEVPYDVVNSATLSIDASYVTASNDGVVVEGEFVGVLNHEYLDTSGPIWTWHMVWDTTTSFDVSGIIASGWNNGEPLSVTVNAIELLGFNYLTLNSSTLELDYDNVDPVPEPGTVLLLGSGILGLIALKRKRRR